MEANSFAERLKALLEGKQLTLTQVARAIGLSPPSVHRWTRGGEIDYANLRALAGYLEVNWIWLRYGDEALDDLRSDAAVNGAMSEQRRRYLGEIMDNEARMNLAQEMAHIVTWELNLLTGEIVASPNATKVFGKPMQALDDFWTAIRDSDLDALAQRFQPDGPPHEWDYRTQNQAGNECWITSRGLLMRDAQGRPVKIIGTSIDITDRKRMEKALEQSEYTLRKVIETIPVGLWVADREGRITTANPEVQRIWGGAKYVGLEEYGDYKGWREATGERIDGSEWTLARAILKGESSPGELVNIEAFDGARRTILMSAIPLLDAEQRIIGAIEVNQDLTGLKQAEMAVRDSEEQLRAVFDQSPVGIACIDADGHLLQANRKLCAFMGDAEAALPDDNLFSVLAAEDAAAVRAGVAQLLDGSTGRFVLNGRLCRRDGGSLCCRITVSPCRPGPSGAPPRLIVILDPAASDRDV